MVIVALLGCAAGLGLTAWVVARGPVFGAVRTGAWTGFPRAGDAGDPYARAAFARSGEIPLGSGEGLSFLARTDEAGSPLRRACTYRIRVPVVPARAWTLTPLNPDGTPHAGTDVRSGLTSAEVLRATDGSVALSVGPEARPGNWLPVRGDGPVVLMFRLYDTVLSTSGSPDAALLPSLALEGCP